MATATAAKAAVFFELFIMRLTNIRAYDFRCFRELAFAPGAQINIISGDNAGGKTSVLEAIYLLGRGESFRGARLGPQIAHGASEFAISAQLLDDRGRRRRVGVSRGN